MEVHVSPDNDLLSTELTNYLMTFIDGERIDLRKFATIPGKTPVQSLAISVMFWITYVYHSIFLLSWAEFDLILEILIMRELNIKHADACIICGVLQHGAKMETLVSLLARKEHNKDGISVLRKAQEEAGRNSFAHGFLHTDNDGRAGIYYREIKNKLTVKRRSLNPRTMVGHAAKFATAVAKVKDHFRVTDDQINDYKNSIASLSSTSPSPASAHPKSETSSRTSG